MHTHTYKHAHMCTHTHTNMRTRTHTHYMHIYTLTSTHPHSVLQTQITCNIHTTHTCTYTYIRLTSWVSVRYRGILHEPKANEMYRSISRWTSEISNLFIVGVVITDKYTHLRECMNICKHAATYILAYERTVSSDHKKVIWSVSFFKLYIHNLQKIYSEATLMLDHFVLIGRLPPTYPIPWRPYLA